MWIQIRSMDGKKSFQVDGISKLTKIEELRERMEKDLNAIPARQRLFFGGKQSVRNFSQICIRQPLLGSLKSSHLGQLEDGHTLFDYNVGLNSLIQVMIRPEEAYLPQSCDEIEEQKDEKGEINKQALIDIINNKNIDKKIDLDEKVLNESSNNDSELRWKVGDLLDGKDLTMGAWFEAEIKTVSFDENGEVRYHVIFDGYDEDEVVSLTEKDVRPRARTKIPFSEVQLGMTLMANYNCDEPKERGFWYDVEVTRKVEKRKSKELFGKLLLGKEIGAAEECRIIFTDELFNIESSDDKVEDNGETPERRKVKPYCDTCRDIAERNCKECGCHKCGEKDEPDRQLMCDECDMAYHMKCLEPPMESLPDEDEWYCPLCKNDGSQVIKAGQKLKESKKKSKMASANSKSNRDWGKGMACVGRTKVCTIVPPNHFGPIPGVPVGSCWKFRVQASEAGIHRPHVSGMHGRDSEGAYSIVLAGGYEDDTDEGDEFTYTGSGGRDLSGNKRTAEQSFDQKLTKTNRALAKNCDCPIDDKKGGVAKDWKKGRPIRVLRSYKFAKHSEYAPEDGVRYDGIYKVLKYWPEKGQSGFIVWRYRLRRDDENPAPWTKAGKKSIKDLGLEIQFPEGYLEAQAKKAAEKEAQKSEKKGKRKRKSDDDDEEESAADTNCTPSKPESSGKKAKVIYNVSEENLEMIKADEKNQKIWMELLENPESHRSFLQMIEERFLCICCQEVVYRPVTVDCGHSTCKPCLTRAFKAGVTSCPACRFTLDKDYNMTINKELFAVLKKLFPGYEAAR